MSKKRTLHDFFQSKTVSSTDQLDATADFAPPAKRRKLSEQPASTPELERSPTPQIEMLREMPPTVAAAELVVNETSDSKEKEVTALDPSLERKWVAGDRVMVWWNKKMLFEAKVLGSDEYADCVSYFVHYLRWSKEWDAWVDASQIFSEATKETRQIARNLNNELDRKDKIRKGKTVAHKRILTEDELRQLPQHEDNEICPPLVIKLSDLLESKIVAERQYHLVHRGVMHLPKPRGQRVFDFFKAFMDSQKKEVDQTEQLQNNQLCSSLKFMFDKMALRNLLYENEEPILRRMVRETNKDASMILGIEHLARFMLFVGSIFEEAENVSPSLKRILQKKLDAFCEFLSDKDALWQPLETYCSIEKVDGEDSDVQDVN